MFACRHVCAHVDVCPRKSKDLLKLRLKTAVSERAGLEVSPRSAEAARALGVASPVASPLPV